MTKKFRNDERQSVLNNFIGRDYDRNKYREMTGVSYVEPKDITKTNPFNLSQSNFGSISKREK